MDKILDASTGLKLSSVCFCRSGLEADVNMPPLIAVGSWDNEQNEVSLWQPSFLSNTAPVDRLVSRTLVLEKAHSLVNLHGSITAMQFSSRMHHSLGLLTTGSISGAVSSFGVAFNYDVVKGNKAQTKLTIPTAAIKAHSAAVTSIGLHESSMTCATVSEDGSAAYIDMKTQTVVQSSQDTAALFGVTYLGAYQICTVGASPTGQVKVWDIRSEGNKVLQGQGMALNKSTKDTNSTTNVYMSVARHPTRPDIIACGTDDGSLVMYDLRKVERELVRIQTHSGAVNGVTFNESNPSQLCTAGSDGVVNMWAFGSHSFDPNAVTVVQLPRSSLLPLNALQWDYQSQVLAVVGDSEKISLYK